VVGAAALFVLAGCTSSGTGDPGTAQSTTAHSAAPTSSAKPTPLPTYSDPAGATARVCTEFQALVTVLQNVPPGGMPQLTAATAQLHIDAANVARLSGNDPRYSSLLSDVAALIAYLDGPAVAGSDALHSPAVQAMLSDCPS
jgi:hypothetical protein